MKVLFDDLVSKIKSVLIHQVGDHRECPHCGERFIPQDVTEEEAWELYKELVEATK